MDFRAVIMAGGMGTRFWPLSRRKKPKQFLPIISDKSMIEETVDRLLPIIPASKIYTVANQEQTETIHTLIPQIPEENLLIEPQGKNTAPSLILATASIFLQNPRATVAALPADHMIGDTSRFLKKIEAGAEQASRGENLITFGIPPSYPATGYGYIQFSKENPSRIIEEYFYAVRKFKEKPDSETAKVFMEKGNYFWNSGMFIWEASVFAKKIEEYAPSMFPFWKRMLSALDKDDKTQIKAIFEEIPSISIDYALMEKAKGVLMGIGNFDWSDVGAWSSLIDIWPKDEKGNALRGKSAILDSEQCLLYNPHKFTALIGVKDIIVVNTEDALLVCHKDQDQKVKEIVENLDKSSEEESL